MKICDNHTLNQRHFPRRVQPFSALSVAALVISCICGSWVPVKASAAPNEEDQIEIIEGEDRTIYEYRQNGILTMIKVVPEKGRAYYMVPADGAPHYESLDHKKKLYPQWVILEW